MRNRERDWNKQSAENSPKPNKRRGSGVRVNLVKILFDIFTSNTKKLKWLLLSLFKNKYLNQTHFFRH